MPPRTRRKNRRKSPEKESDPDFLLFGESEADLAAKKGLAAAKAFGEHDQPDAPNGVDLSADVTTLGSQALGKLLQYYTGMHAFLLERAAVADVRASAAKDSFQTYQKHQRYLKKGDGKAQWEIDAEVQANSEYTNLQATLTQAEAYNEALRAKVKGIELKCGLISREITRRGTEKA